MNRLTSAFEVSAINRRVFAAGGFAAVLAKGAEEAGAIFLLVRDRLGAQALYGPAAQTAYDDGRPGERYFRLLLRTEDPFDERIEAKIASERRFDPDLWLLELEGGPPIEELVQLVRSDDPDF
ncbi:DUF1491 family protein [Notoacmeibacter ruber]|uniref:DUF1491 family protein n=1 Tax=Notoacmeibacter ruber TaxID=2670375 RepID=A0A3L7J9Z8_9HYPH|nr:DUF1491 family protein [Notoacmeibacter ruber]RLQ87523.1 DUF1491 family protein [Notoacmeibacter ruber]